mmetsp:Transcript_18131/g.72581  ORF Transcript_18131/g.72581 Transcript_18131/m.72581 type:complete len:145 (-) Transcript_18131:1945-2379(-)
MQHPVSVEYYRDNMIVEHTPRSITRRRMDFATLNEAEKKKKQGHLPSYGVTLAFAYGARSMVNASASNALVSRTTGLLLSSASLLRSPSPSADTAALILLGVPTTKQRCSGMNSASKSAKIIRFSFKVLLSSLSRGRKAIRTSP